jgi:hypothetical protein
MTADRPIATGGPLDYLDPELAERLGFRPPEAQR